MDVLDLNSASRENFAKGIENGSNLQMDRMDRNKPANLVTQTFNELEKEKDEKREAESAKRIAEEEREQFASLWE
ncbi:10258_t:CDS:2, partial [Racocetra persica]